MEYQFHGTHRTPAHIAADELEATPGGVQHRYYVRPILAYALNRVLDGIEGPFRRNVWPYMRRKQ